ncbi:hypothetical protein HPB48_014740 [Haemaphysalis longicornis]|uniref:Uncharacterized protein n=1 Tax=Haemaphysalis longicornis TaxID=44386 RepID=A0A9J6H601_HAELO|nr:hypothetical protein HPB48_014740 [Haemaphysalis longicornis]
MEITGSHKRRVTPRKIVNGLVLNHELDLLEIRVNELRDSVDYYVIVEANYTFFGTRKPLHLTIQHECRVFERARAQNQTRCNNLPKL